MQRMTVRFPSDLLHDAQKAAKREGMSFAVYVREATAYRVGRGDCQQCAHLRERVEKLERQLGS